MRSQTAIALVVLGGGVTAMAVDIRPRCTDPATGQPTACQSGQRASYLGWTHFGGSATRGPSLFSHVVRGGFGAAGHGAAAGS